MSNRKQYLLVLIATWAITLMPSMYFAYRQVQENKIVDQYLSSNNLNGKSITKETAVRVSDLVRKDFNINKNTFAALNMKKRPFLREDVGFLLTYKEGLCGEGARVIVNLLNRLGFDATRITLFNRKLLSSHTLASIVINEHEFLVDSINSSVEFNELVKNTDISTTDYNIMHYSDNYTERQKFKNKATDKKPEGYAKFFDYYWLYSYETIPYSKLLTRLGLDVRVFNLKRPHSLLSNIAEKPNIVMFIISFIVSVLTIYLLHKLKIIRNIFRIGTI